MHGVLVAQVPGTFQMGNLCFVEDAAPVLNDYFRGIDENQLVELADGFANDASQIDGSSDGLYLTEPTDPTFFDESAVGPEPDVLSPLISDLAFTDPHVQKCVTLAAEASLAERSNDLAVISCNFPGNPAVSLDDLSHFPYLEIITLNGASLISLAPLGGMADLSQVMVKDSTIQSFGDLSSLTAICCFPMLNQRTGRHWPALVLSQSR